MSKNADHIGFAAAAIGITCTTIGHYAEEWAAAYFVAILGGLIVAAIFSE